MDQITAKERLSFPRRPNWIEKLALSVTLITIVYILIIIITGDF